MLTNSPSFNALVFGKKAMSLDLIEQRIRYLLDRFKEIDPEFHTGRILRMMWANSFIYNVFRLRDGWSVVRIDTRILDLLLQFKVLDDTFSLSHLVTLLRIDSFTAGVFSSRSIDQIVE